MNLMLLIGGSLAAAASVILTGVLTRYAPRLGLLDTPNERSSHAVPTPRGGGVAIVVTSSVGFSVFGWLGILDLSLALGLVVGGLAVALVGFLDDFRRIPVSARLAVHIGAAIWALYFLGAAPTLQLGERLVELDGLWYPVHVLGIVWVINLFNFMDGIDGIAASEAVFIILAATLLAFPMGVSSNIPTTAAVLVGSCLGFLYWNWPPAKVFMGDVGSGYLGFVIAVFALKSATDSSAALLVWLILGGVFFIDATVTLTRRFGRGERVSQAHRSHAYQWLARRWRSHQRVTVLVIAINVAVLFPLAIWSALQPHRAAYIAAGALLFLVITLLAAGAGRAEEPTPAKSITHPPTDS